MKINTAIFRAYDIRGKYPSELNSEVMERIGEAVAIFFSRKLKKKKLTIVVCRDVRTSSLLLKAALVRGLLAQGADVRDVGIGTSPYFVFLMHHVNPDGGIMVTASHNPPNYNGLKFRLRGGKSVYRGTGLEIIQKMLVRRELQKSASEGHVLGTREYIDAYLNFLTRRMEIGRVSAVIDAAGGSVAYFLPRLLQYFPKFIYKPLFFTPDGSFRRHPPNPLLPEAQEFVKRELHSGKFAFGAVFDGDGDRVMFFDERGNFVHPDFILGLFAAEALARHPRSTIVFPVTASRGVREYARERGVRPKLSKRGYVFIQAAMRRARALFSAEFSGHYFFKEFFYDDSGLLALLHVARILSKTPRPFSQLVAPFQRYLSSGERNYAVKDAKKLLARIENFYPDAKISTLDGVTVEYPEWWVNVRPSNTEPVVRVTLEAKTKPLFDEKLREVERLLRGS